MATHHAKSPCCQTLIRRFGRRRRQCCSCKRTWTIRPKKRGRPCVRVSSTNEILSQVFVEGLPLKHLARRRPHLSSSGFRHRFRQLLRRFVVSPRSLQRRVIPKGPLILLADGLWFNFKDEHWVLYLTALRACRGKTAVFLDPILIPDREGALKWQQVFQAIPHGVKARIRALVADNLQGMKLIAKHNRWAFQLCHFHLILKLQLQRGRSRNRQRRALRGGEVREELYQLIRRALEVPEGPVLRDVMNRLNHLAHTSCGTQRVQAVVRDFLQSISFYRTYLAHPELHLPTTTNTMESMGSIVRNLLRRNRSASSPRSLLLWTTALIRMRPEVTCNGKILNRIN